MTLLLALLFLPAMPAEGVAEGDSASCEKEQNLSNVTVKRERPHMKIGSNGSIAYDAKQLSQYRPVTNALDLLDEIPLIEKDFDKYKISETGQTTVTINGRKTQMTREEVYGYLNSMPASQIKTIEIYNVAPPQFGTQGGVINFVTDQKRDTNIKANGSAWASLYQGSRFYHTGGVNAVVFEKKWMLNTAFSLGNLKETKRYNVYSDHNIDGETHHIVNPSTRYSNNSAIKVTADFTYDFSKTSMINCTYMYRTDNPDYRFTSPLWIDDMLDSRNCGYYQSAKRTHAFLASYTNKGWRMGADLVLFRNGDSQNILDDTEDTPALSSMAEQKNKRGTFYINNTQKIGKGKLTYGAEMQWANVRNTFANIWKERIKNENTSKDNTQREHKWRGFLGWTQSMKQMTIVANITAEYFKSTRTQDKQKQTLWDKVTLEPNITVNYKMDPKHTIIGSFSTNRTYPLYLNTSGRTAYYNHYFYISNDTKVESYTSYGAVVKMVTSNKYIVGCYAIIEPNRYIQILKQDDNQLSAGLHYYNFDTCNRTGLMAIIPHSWSTNFDSRLTAYLSCDHTKGNRDGMSFDKRKLAAQFALTNNIVLDRKRTTSLQINASYSTNKLFAYAYDTSPLLTSISLTWKPQNSGWSVVAKFNDPLDTYHPVRVIKHNTQSSKLLQMKDTRKVNVTVRYSLKGYKEKKIKEADTSRMGI